MEVGRARREECAAHGVGLVVNWAHAVPVAW